MPFDFGLSADQASIEDLFSSFFANESPTAVVRAAEPLGFSPALWAALRGFDATGIGAPAADGGGGATLVDLVVVAEALGHAIAPVPLVEHVVASRAHPTAAVVSGEQIATIALRPASADGVWRLVPGGAVADVVIGVDGLDLVATQSEAPDVAPVNHACAPLADRSARAATRTVIGAATDFDVILDEWRVLTAAALVGIAAASLELALAYVLERQQFGRPIGSYQALQHGLADFPGLIDGARFLTHKAAWAADGGRRGAGAMVDIDNGEVVDAAVLASMAFVQAAEAAAVCTDRGLHYHGGYGFSAEYDIQLYFRRARGWANVLGDPARERLRLADLLWPVGAR
ncbi:MAG TPA: acyl-CoA dehydrogenase family protein [Ilumatobacteraceae bacterium]